MISYVRKGFNITLGIILLIVAAILGPVPLFPGFVVAIPAFYLLAKEIPWLEKHYENFKARIKSKTGSDPEEYARSFFRRILGYFRRG